MEKETQLIEFTKMTAGGNDFVLIDGRTGPAVELDRFALARHACDRRRGIGADGLIVLARSSEPGCAGQMLFANADGSPAPMCGNGARCLALLARDSAYGVRDDAGAYVRMQTASGVHVAQVCNLTGEAAHVRLWLPEARCVQASTPLSTAAPLPRVSRVWASVDHVVGFVDAVDRTPVASWGRRIRFDAALAPDGANVCFVEVETGEAVGLRVRTYERGVEAETPSCGTGAVSAVVAARATGRIGAQRVRVVMPGGELGVSVDEPGDAPGPVCLYGPVQIAFRGTLAWQPGPGTGTPPSTNRLQVADRPTSSGHPAGQTWSRHG